ncbi:MAG: TIGR04053 family radical SAM/SPASM domain-containing protein [Candidatus Omnitrophica bacterium]|nr:TIGR04053 family radical SAM/SPASM domain-containing protein [Candidatus Omnitrophota bacterium]
MMQVDYAKQPFLVIWESTRACDLACLHCRAEADSTRDPEELSTGEAKKLIRDVQSMGTPIFIISGGDPLKRPDLIELVRYSKESGLRTGTIPAVTPLLVPERIDELKSAGLDQIAFSLDAADPAAHDAFRRTEGVFERTIKSVEYANRIGLNVQINSLVNVHNTESLEALITLVRRLKIVFWEVFFLVPTGRGRELELISAAKFDAAFDLIYRLHREAEFVIKVTEAPHYRKYFVDREEAGQGAASSMVRSGAMPGAIGRVHGPGGSLGRAPQGVNSGKGFLFVSHKGEIMPSGFLPITAGNVRTVTLGEIYRGHSLFKDLRDTALLKGKCGRCSFKEMCGGSRARAYALTGDYLAEEPCCSYEPPRGDGGAE